MKADATMITAGQWSERDEGLALEWLDKHANELGVKLNRAQLKNMVARAHVPSERPGSYEIDQMRLVTALRSLSLADDVSDNAINAVMPPALTESVYDLMEAAVRRDRHHTANILRQLKMSDDPYLVLGSLMSQWTQLVSVALIQRTDSSRVGELSLHPFVVKKMTSLASGITQSELRHITKQIASIDSRLKLSEFDPWDGISRLIIAIVTR